MTNSSTLLKIKNELLSIPDLEILDKSVDLQRFSKDFFDYSPILSNKLTGSLADLVVRPTSVEAVLSVASLCNKFNVPLTLRGAGTGNYGQCVPLFGGIVMNMLELKNIKSFDQSTGIVTVEPGCLLNDLNKYLVGFGRQLRLLPSTWRTASIGGFIAGGSGGIGSVQWGFLRDPGHLLGLEIVTVEDSPRQLKLDALQSEPINHAYGTNGIITSLTLATAPLVNWHEIVVDCEDWNRSVHLLKTFSCSSVQLYLCTLIEDKIVNYLPHSCGKPKGNHRLYLLVAPDGVTTIRGIALSQQASFTDLGPESERLGNGMRELTWNHTTLHMRSNDPGWTYLQMILPEDSIEAMHKLKKKWGDDLLWHLESVSQHGTQRIAALPIIRWKGEKEMEEFIHHCREIDAVIFNPHAITVEDGGLGIIDADQVYAKKIYDPKGVLNPGKLKGWNENK